MTDNNDDMVIEESKTTVHNNNASKPNRLSGDDLPWVEKHRPRLLADIVGNHEAVNRLDIIAKQGNMPNIILTGPPGTGMYINSAMPGVY